MVRKYHIRLIYIYISILWFFGHHHRTDAFVSYDLVNCGSSEYLLPFLYKQLEKRATSEPGRTTHQ